jgi:hypothetical protein
MKRAAQPEELSPAYVFLAAPVCSGYITGIVLPITGSVDAICRSAFLQYLRQKKAGPHGLMRRVGHRQANAGRSEGGTAVFTACSGGFVRICVHGGHAARGLRAHGTSAVVTTAHQKTCRGEPP